MAPDNSINSRPTPRPEHDPDASARSLGDLATRRAEQQRTRYRAGDVLLGRYRIMGALGQGGMGLVFRCFDEVGGIEVALKALPPELSHNTVEMEEVRENFQLVQGLHHPNIAAVKTLEKDPGTGDVYLVMECVDGISLRQWRKQIERQGTGDAGHQSSTDNQESKLAAVLPVLRQIAAALDFAHSQRIIHRDIKPSNVMLRADGAVKLLDFGLAAQIHTSLSRVSRVRYGTSGTGPYMAPEQWRGQPQDAATDQYSLAVLAYELLAGRLPFESADPAVLREAVLHEPPPPIPGLDGRTWKALCKALAKERAARYASCGEFVAALSGLAGRGRRYSVLGIRYWVLGAGVAAVLAVAAQRGCHSYRLQQFEQRTGAASAVALKTEAEKNLRQKEPSPGDIQTVDLGGGVKLEMVWCPPGTFMMGSPSGEAGRWYDDTQHRVTLTKGFWMGKYEVTQAQWEAVMGSNPSYFKNAGRSAPVEQVSWDDCQEFVRKLNVRVPGGGFRLPTEAEWEYACRAGTTTAIYTGPLTIRGEHNGPELDAIAWYGGNSGVTYEGGYDSSGWPEKQYSHSRAGTHPVGQKQPNAWGLRDMLGNVWEWCADWHGEYLSGSVTDPLGPGSGSDRVGRGGGWDSFARNCRSANRRRCGPGFRSFSLGLRLARSPQ